MVAWGLPLSLRLRPSRFAVMVLAVIHGMAIAAIAVSYIASFVKAILLVLIAYSLATSLRRHALRRGSDAVVSLTLRERGELDIGYGDGRRIAFRLDSSSMVLHWLMALRLRQQHKSCSLFLLPDMLEDASWRRLLVHLRAAKVES